MVGFQVVEGQELPEIPVLLILVNFPVPVKVLDKWVVCKRLQGGAYKVVFKWQQPQLTQQFLMLSH
jgi:hypothetical protein